MSYQVLTFTHKTAALKTLGELVLPNDDSQLGPYLAAVQAELGLSELFYLATCNRVLFVWCQDQTESLAPALIETLYGPRQLAEKANAVAQTYQGTQAIQHFFEVASSIDSLVVGEREILRQLRQAYEQCRQWGLTGDSLRLLMRFTVEIAKDVYTHTRIGEKPVSVVSLAVQQLLAQHPSRQARLLIIGAGQTNSLLAKLLKKEGFQHFSVFNRSLENAQRLAQSLGGSAHSLDELDTHQASFDILVACTAATEAVISPERYAKLIQGDKTKNNKILIDLSVPNNIDPSIPENFPCTWIEIEGLQCLAKQNLSFRQQEVEKAKTMIQLAVSEFETAYQARQIELALREVPNQIKAVREHALNNLFKSEVERLDHESRALIEKMMAYMEKRCIAIPIQVAKENLLEKPRSSSQHG